MGAGLTTVQNAPDNRGTLNVNWPLGIGGCPAGHANGFGAWRLKRFGPWRQQA